MIMSAACTVAGVLLLAPRGVGAAGPGCTDDLDCSLNGVCSPSTAVCVCDRPWAGASCGRLLFKAVSFPQGYGMAPNLTAWGGGAIRNPKDGRYHAFIHTVAHGCPLACGDNSRIEHAVSDNVTGPYAFSDVAVPMDARNSAPVVLPDGTFAIFHIHTGVPSPNSGAVCAPDNAPPFDTIGAQLRSRLPFRCPSTATPAAAARSSSAGSSIHTSASLAGPWLPVVPNTLPACGNPAPHVLDNGTIFIVCQHTEFYRAESVHGPWTLVTSLTNVTDGAGGGVPGKYEDPFLWRDRRSNWHIMYHVYNTDDGKHGGPGACANATVSGHLFSRDGRTWRPSAVGPYTARVALTGGREVTVSTRERPNIFFDAAGQMTHLFNAVCSATGDDCAASTGTGCVDRKYEAWDYNLVAPLDV